MLLSHLQVLLTQPFATAQGPWAVSFVSVDSVRHAPLWAPSMHDMQPGAWVDRLIITMNGSHCISRASSVDPGAAPPAADEPAPPNEPPLPGAPPTPDELPAVADEPPPPGD